jgi:hypothetical protein
MVTIKSQSIYLHPSRRFKYGEFKRATKSSDQKRLGQKITSLVIIEENEGLYFKLDNDAYMSSDLQTLHNIFAKIIYKNPQYDLIRLQ